MQDDQDYRDLVVGKLAKLEQISTDTLEQAKKTNGRVNKLEDRVDAHDIAIALDQAQNTRWEWWRAQAGKALFTLLIGLVGFCASLVFQKFNFFEVSVVTPEQYDSLPE